MAKELEEKDKFITGLQDELDAIKAQLLNNYEVEFLEKQNKELGASITRWEKEAFSAQLRVKEVQEALADRSKEREKEADHKRILKARIKHLRSKMEDEQNVTELVIQQKVKEKEDREKREIKKRIDEVKREQVVLKQLHKDKEDHVDKMSHDKIAVQQETVEIEQSLVKVEKEIKDKKERIIELKNYEEALTQEEKELIEKLKPIVKENKELLDKIPALERHVEETEKKIRHIEKLNELSVQLKNVNLEELKVLTQSNDQISTTISDLTRKWDTLKSLVPGKQE